MPRTAEAERAQPKGKRSAEPQRAARNSRGMPLSPSLSSVPPLDTTGALPPGRGIGSFVLRELVERDDFTLGYRAVASASDAEVLIEEYWPAALVERAIGGEPVLRDSGLAALFDAGLAAFVDEAEQLARIDDPALLKFGPVWRVHGTACRLRVETPARRAGRTLAARATLSDEAALRALAEPLLGALDAVHRAGLVHGNVRPGNVVLRDDGSPMLLDFGAASAAIARQAPWRAPQPEPAFAAPELHLYGRQPTAAADLYSLSALLWFCGSGELPDKPSAAPAAAPRWAVLKRRHPSLRLSEGWLQALDAALAFDADARPQSVEAFRRLLAEPATPAAAPVPVWREAPAASFFAAPEAASAPQPFGPFPPMRAVDDDPEPTWKLADFAATVLDAPRAEPAPWPTASRPALFDGPAATSDVRDAPEHARPMPPKSRHWPWALGGALVGGAAMLVFGLGWERLAETPALDRLVQLAMARPAGEVTIPAQPTAAGGTVLSTTETPTESVTPAPPQTPVRNEATTGVVATGATAAAGSSTVATVQAGPSREPAAGAGVESPRKALAAARTGPVAVAVEADPASACAPRSNFSLYLCMKTQCERSAWYAHPQCVQLRREDER